MRTEAASAPSIAASDVWVFCDGCNQTQENWDHDHPPDGCTGSVKHAALVSFGEGLAVIDADTGELLEVRKPDQREPFRVHDSDSADWVMALIAEVDGDVVALERRRAALLANMDAMIADQQRRADWLRLRFGKELRAFAETELLGRKTRTLKLAWGSLSFRRKPARVVVDDEDRAIAWAKVNAPDAVKVEESILVSRLDDLDPLEPPPGFKTVPAEDNFQVVTGVKG